MNKQEIIDKLAEGEFNKNTQPELGYAALDINVGCTPAIRFLCAAEGFAIDIANELELKLWQVVYDAFHGRVFDASGLLMSAESHEGLVNVSYHTPEWRQEDHLARIQESFRNAPVYIPSTEHKPGWWRVDGIRHEALVKANSEAEAIEKADQADAVGSWESATATLMYELDELPDVLRF